MEDMTIVCFYEKKDCAAKKRRRDKWQYFAEVERVSLPCGSLTLYRVQIPVFAYKKKCWKEQTLADYFAGLEVPAQSGRVLYQYDEWVKNLICREEETLSEEWLMFLLDFYHLHFDGLIILADRELATESIIWNHVRDIRYLGLLSKDPEEWQELQESLSEEYGILADVKSEFKQLHPCNKEGQLVVASDNFYGVTPAQLKPECTWLSARADSYAKRICARAGNVRYIDIEVFMEDVLRP